MRKLAVVATLVLSVTSATKSFAADCNIDHYNFVFGQDTSTHMTVKSGKTCGSTIRTNGGGLRSLAIAQSPQSGNAMTPTSVRWEYRSKPGYSGKDSFVVQGSGESMSNKRGATHSGNVNINVDVDVVP